MDIREEVLAELDELIEEGKRCEASFRREHPATTVATSTLEESQLRAFIVKARATVKRISGASSEFYKMLPADDDTAFKRRLEKDHVPIPSALGVLRALRDAVEKGHLESLEARLREAIHDDFLEQAKALLSERYHVAAMVLIGGVLENHLRKLCEGRGLRWDGRGSLSKYNDACKDAEVYRQPKWRRIQEITDLRNEAAHGNGDKVDAADVGEACEFVGRFVEEFPE